VLGSLGRLFIPVKADKIVMQIPFYKDLVLARINYITLFGLGTMIQNGVSMEKSLLLSAESTTKGLLKQDLICAAQAVKNGKPWAAVMSHLHPTDRASLSSAQDRDQVAKSIRSLADQYKYLYGQRVAATTPMLMLTSSLFLVIAGAVLFGLGVEPILQLSAKGTF
jgi:general secretion pathway protein F